MARVELRKPINSLLEEQSTIDKRLNQLNDEFNRFHEELKNLRGEQFGYREGLAALSKTAQNGPARKVFNESIAHAELRIKDVMKEIERVEKDRVVWTSKLNAIKKSVKELQNS